ncbi:MAG: response regulator [Acidobacteriota bacterium]
MEATPQGQDGSPAQVLLVDDHTLFRQGLLRLLDRSVSLEVIGEASSGEEALILCDRLHPDVVVMDLVMPGLGGLASIRQLQNLSPPPRILVLTMRGGKAYRDHARAAGAQGYVPKDAGIDRLLEALSRVAGGEEWFPPMPASDGSHRPESGRPVKRALTSREIEVLVLITEGFSNREAAVKLGISPRTVEAHRRVINQKLGTRGLAGLVRYAIKNGLVGL